MNDHQLIAQLARAGVVLAPGVKDISTPLAQYAMDAASLTPTSSAPRTPASRRS